MEDMYKMKFEGYFDLTLETVKDVTINDLYFATLVKHKSCNELSRIDEKVENDIELTIEEDSFYQKIEEYGEIPTGGIYMQYVVLFINLHGELFLLDIQPGIGLEKSNIYLFRSLGVYSQKEITFIECNDDIRILQDLSEEMNKYIEEVKSIEYGYSKVKTVKN